MKGVEKEATITVIKVYFLIAGSWFIALPPEPKVVAWISSPGLIIHPVYTNFFKKQVSPFYV